jgi:RNase P subunit RPR2
VQKKNQRKETAKKNGLLVECPLCRTPLLKGEDLISRVYRPMNVPHQLCTINGCPHCFPVAEPGLKRICPVCHREVPVDGGNLIARLFNKSDGKKHVVVTGCTECSRGAK